MPLLQWGRVWRLFARAAKEGVTPLLQWGRVWRLITFGVQPLLQRGRRCYCYSDNTIGVRRPAVVKREVIPRECYLLLKEEILTLTGRYEGKYVPRYRDITMLQRLNGPKCVRTVAIIVNMV